MGGFVDGSGLGYNVCVLWPNSPHAELVTIIGTTHGLRKIPVKLRVRKYLSPQSPIREIFDHELLVLDTEMEVLAWMSKCG